jgi:RHS repeat-associated protein
MGDKFALMAGQALGRARVPLPAGAVADYTSGPSLLDYWHTDWLGSVRLASTPNRTMYYDAGIAPYGEHYVETGTTKGVFADMVQNTITGMYDTPNREYDTTSGRWLWPDPAGLAAADPSNPQSWNRYAYVLNCFFIPAVAERPTATFQFND